ncbi:AsmA family protein [Roseibium sediminis]|uniref:AsmA family protein n=1 Tax=Roseibium sediminis TaxID=1775174 RepID=UPI00123E38B5|nr:AsmA family protein [Roseibium sediminis]
MRRILLGLASLLFLAVAAILIIPFFLPKDVIKNQVIAEIDNRFGWQLRLDGPVSLSLFPGFSLHASDVGISGEAGADGIEFASARDIEIGLGWAGLLGGEIQVTGIRLDQPAILMDIGPRGLASWEPRRGFMQEVEAQETARTEPANAPSSTPETSAGEGPAATSILQRIGIDRVEIVEGTLQYRDHRSGSDVRVSNLNLLLKASDLDGLVELDSKFRFKDKPFEVQANVDNPLALVAGDIRPIRLDLSSDETRIGLEGNAGILPLRVDLAVKGSAPGLQALAALADTQMPSIPGALDLSGRIEGTDAAVSLTNLVIALGEMAVNGSVDVNLGSQIPETAGRLVVQNASLTEVLALAGQTRPASGLLGADVAFSMQGLDAPTILSTLNANGALSLTDGRVGGLGLASSFNNDPAADEIRDLSLRVDVSGLDSPIRLTGGLSWRNEGFSVTGNASVAPILAGLAAPVAVNIKNRQVALGFDGQASTSGAIDGAVTIDTPNLRNLLAWIGQPVEAGNGLQKFMASGLFSVNERSVSFEEASFMLDDTSGRGSGTVLLGDRPSIKARLALSNLALDPYMQGGGQAAAAPKASGGTAPAPSGAPAPASSSNWSSAPIDFSGLRAVDADFDISTQSITMDKIKIGQSRLTATIKGGVLNAQLAELQLYNGSGSGAVTLNGAASVPEISAKFSLKGLSAYPFLRDSADFEWLEGSTALALDVSTRGQSQKALVEALNGTASFAFHDGAIRGINIPRMVRGLTVETLLGWQENPAEKTDFSALSASFQIQNGLATNQDLQLAGPLINVSGGGTTNLAAQTLDWRIEPQIVPTLDGQAPAPRKKGADKKFAGLGVPVIIRGSWNNPQFYPDIQGILENPELAYQQLQALGGGLFKDLNKKPEEALVDTANKVIERATGGKAQIDVQKVIDGEVDDKQILEAVEQGFGLPSGLLQSFGIKKN